MLDSDLGLVSKSLEFVLSLKAIGITPTFICFCCVLNPQLGVKDLESTVYLQRICSSMTDTERNDGYLTKLLTF